MLSVVFVSLVFLVAMSKKTIDVSIIANSEASEFLTLCTERCQNYCGDESETTCETQCATFEADLESDLEECESSDKVHLAQSVHKFKSSMTFGKRINANDDDESVAFSLCSEFCGEYCAEEGEDSEAMAECRDTCEDQFDEDFDECMEYRPDTTSTTTEEPEDKKQEAAAAVVAEDAEKVDVVQKDDTEKADVIGEKSKPEEQGGGEQEPKEEEKKPEMSDGEVAIIDHRNLSPQAIEARSDLALKNNAKTKYLFEEPAIEEVSAVVEDSGSETGTTIDLTAYVAIGIATILLLAGIYKISRMFCFNDNVLKPEYQRLANDEPSQNLSVL